MSFSAANLRWHVLGPRSGGTTGAALGQGLGLSSMTSAAGPQARLQAQAITNLGPIYWNDPSWLFGILGDLYYASPSSLTKRSVDRFDPEQPGRP